MEFQKQKIGKWLVGALLILVVPNILFWLLGLKVNLTRGVFVLEYLLIASLYPYINRKLFITTWVLFAIYDLFYSATSLFFMDFLEIAHALTKVPAMPLVDMLKWAGMLILFIGVVFGLLTLLMRYDVKHRVMHLRFLWPLIILCFFINAFSAQKAQANKSIVSAPSWPFIKAVQHAIIKSTAKRNIELLGSAAKKIFIEAPGSGQVKKEALILVESWGLLADSSLQHEVMQPLSELSKQNLYTIKEGTTSYKYLTQAGEFRELTGYVFHYYQVKDSWVKENSLLVKKQQQGYHVVGIHGNTGQFYRRQMIWPILGVQEMHFSEDFAKQNMPLCGSYEFKGVCDTAINTWLLNTMNRQPNRKEFYYWVTLNTHLPLIEVHDEGYTKFAQKWKQRGITENILQMAYQHQMLFKDLAGKLSKPGSSKAHILLVGDHAPPFIDPADRKLLNDHLVPYVELVPN
jgi:hypothetical protein